ncbi:MAG: UDP-N-acetylmuramate dehydrogenase [Clostridium sp.]|nr:UDP-N-acetylmuramate dehydrogenase [Clostridium sp.]
MNLDRMLKETLVSEGSVYKTMEPMSRHTTFRIGGPAAFFAGPSNEEELAAVLRLCGEYGIPWKILGNGSNLLVSDQGVEGVVIAMEHGWNYGRVQNGLVTAGAGLLLSRAAHLAFEASLEGLEFAAGIPGTVGGALVMNAGAYGSEIKAVLVSAKVMTPQGETLDLKAEELKLGYRSSIIPEAGYVVLEAVFGLKPGEKDGIEARMKDLAARRKEKQPLEYPSAGSTFKRPEGYFAGKLIEDAGLRGYRLGGAQVSEKHCGFVINREGATAADVINLCRHVQSQVKANAGVDLDMEVKRWGVFSDAP